MHWPAIPSNLYQSILLEIYRLSLPLDIYLSVLVFLQCLAAMLTAAVAKINGFFYAPDKDVYWKQGRSQDNSYIYVTTQYLTAEMLDDISLEVSSMENLLICASAFDIGLSKRYDNINIRKIPQSVLSKCEYGVDNYNLNIINPPEFDEDEWEDCEDA